MLYSESLPEPSSDEVLAYFRTVDALTEQSDIVGDYEFFTERLRRAVVRGDMLSAQLWEEHITERETDSRDMWETTQDMLRSF